MIQEIAPRKFYNQYEPCEPEADSPVCIFRKGKMLARVDAAGMLIFPTRREFGPDLEAQYLFRIDETRYYLVPDETNAPEGYEFEPLLSLRQENPDAGASMFAACTAYHLWKWYRANRYCGVCGHKTETDEIERALICPECGNRIYPRLNPAVIIGVINGESLLITKYRTGYGNSALVAGFTEIGETFEETVAREVMEEAGVRVKNIRYYKSQPWGPAEDILAGYYCEVDGDDRIRMDQSELKYAEWVPRKDIELQPTNYSLTNEMMRMFKEGKVSELSR